MTIKTICREWNLLTFLQECEKIHGRYKFTYSQIKEEDIKSSQSIVDIRCVLCRQTWQESISQHLERQKCPNLGCRDIRPRKINRMTLELFVEKAWQKYGNKYNYSKNQARDIVNNKSKIKFSCNICGYCNSGSINHHLSEDKGCLDCRGFAPLTYERFIEKAIAIHSSLYDYSQIRNQDIKNAQSRIIIVCRECQTPWESTPSSHVYGKHGCSVCAQIIRWTRERFIKRSQELNGDKIDYSLIADDDIANARSHVTLICKDCQTNWVATIANHVRGKHRCPGCHRGKPWTYERFIREARDIHGDTIDYSLVTEEIIDGKNTRVHLICNICQHHWEVAIFNHIYNRTGCPCCRSSKGEMECSIILGSLGIKYIREYKIKQLPNRKYDFFFIYGDNHYLLEFDGEQHFNDISFFNKLSLLERQDIDLTKTRMALHAGYYVIRIDYTCINNIESHIEEALYSEAQLYVSDEDLYSHILDKL